jgi:CubicO group peptidase (beta-lactamase class C family)
MRPSILICMLIFAMLTISCAPPKPELSEKVDPVKYFPPPEREGGWRTNTDPEFVRSLGLDPEAMEEFGRFNLEVPASGWQPYASHTGTILIKDGWIVGEWYNTPAAKKFRTYISSNGKSFAITCFGMMMADSRSGKIPFRIDRESKVYDPRWLANGFPLSDSRKEQITFEMIFRHTSGLAPERDARGGNYEQGRNAWTWYPDWIVGHDKAWPVTGKLAFDPGHPEQFAGSDEWGMVNAAYSSVSFGHVGLVLQNVYGRPAWRFLWERICRPIGFSGLDFHGPPEPEEDIRWFSAGALRMTPRDYARFAYFLLNDGRWEDKQLAPSEFLSSFREQAIYPNMKSNADGFFGEEFPPDMFRIAGSGLNWAYIIPSQNLIALRTGRGHNEMWAEVRSGFLERLAKVMGE